MSGVGITGLILLVIPVAVAILVIYFIVSTIKGFEKRANEKLLIERENTLILQRRVADLEGRLLKVETLLKEVD
ncbi:hypothetical protein [Paenibacillus radicis (ex Gao et al. 2016)]|uniref:Phage shock protein B n=1 Tax=Paenibacillus radicis (ex Gao et al. 2016) TaxID=1737354 RepID=A0A917HAT8_9BACL|nr:hypothetical protein [Paenibacillus radicis (ex Gao et al. 2016)]GGG72908.1 hypothetical protein GCM10010918_31100 [Paenibacillus radicis (ex Gao et al. 2016)]